MDKIRILGIAGSPRHGNTEIAVKAAPASAAELPDVETEFYSMAGKKINPCKSLRVCWTAKATIDNICPEWGPDDELSILMKRMVNFDGFILGSPVYVGGISAQLKSLLDRMAEQSYHGPLGQMAFRNKVVGAVSQGGMRHGGQELTIMAIWAAITIIDMIPVPSGPGRQGLVCP